MVWRHSEFKLEEMAIPEIGPKDLFSKANIFLRELRGIWRKDEPRPSPLNILWLFGGLFRTKPLHAVSSEPKHLKIKKVYQT